jgi:hypothetical protein
MASGGALLFGALWKSAIAAVVSVACIVVYFFATNPRAPSNEVIGFSILFSIVIAPAVFLVSFIIFVIAALISR